MSNLYKFLGLGQNSVNSDIPKQVILDNADSKDRDNLGWSFAYVDSICLRYSVEGDDGIIQVMEVALNTPKNIEEIAKLMQKTIKYKILFVFKYQDRYLVMARNFRITDSTGYVYTSCASCCTDWIYPEELKSDILYSYCASGDVLRNVAVLNKCIIEAESISYRRFVDWFNSHIVGEKLDLMDVMDEAIGRGIVNISDESVFFDKNQLSCICAELRNSVYVSEIGRTGRDPRCYFEHMEQLATFDSEYEFISDSYLYHDDCRYNDCYDSFDYRTEGEGLARELLWSCQGMYSRVAC